MNFAQIFEELTGNQPFPWQEALFEQFMTGGIPDVCHIPTGLGKTSAIAIWLIALSNGARVPRRLVYVVNRRTVVDQTTNEAVRLRRNCHKIGIPHLAISTLRGRFADNQEWSSDPSRPAIICGTVDMIGSRLLFSGYRIGFKSRPLHAGFLGQDVLLLHDEAHLEPAFQALVESIIIQQKNEHRQQLSGRELPWPGMKVMALTATGRNGNETIRFGGLTQQENDPPVMIPDPPSKPIHHVWRRLRARKELKLHCITSETKLAGHIAELALEHKESSVAVLIFARTIKDIRGICKALTNDKKGGLPSEKVQLLTGTMRGFERERLIAEDPVYARFLSESDRSAHLPQAEGTVCLVCTSAGEVGVNLSGDHMVCDLSTFDSMAQRFGRVNRFGNHCVTRIDVVYSQDLEMEGAKSKGDDKISEIDERRRRTLDLLMQLNGDASPLSLEQLDGAARIAAFAPEPTILPTTAILFDAWAMTTIRDQMPGRPPVAPYLHGVCQWEPPRTGVAWRNETEYITIDLIDRYGEDFPRTLLDDYPLKPQELLNGASERVYEELTKLDRRLGKKCPIWLVADQNEISIIQLDKLLAKEKKQVVSRIAGSIILLPPWAGGLTDQGTLDGEADYDEGKRPIYDVADQWLDENNKKRRQRLFSHQPQSAEGPKGMALFRVIDIDPDADEVALSGNDAAPESYLNEEISSSRRDRYWCWYTKPRDAEDATPASTLPILWSNHTDSVVAEAEKIMTNLNWTEPWSELAQAVLLAAAFHDLGKKRELWQVSIGNPDPTVWYAKPGKPESGPRWRPQPISPYRHELGSLLDLTLPHKQHEDPLSKLSDEMKDVVLHLIAAHHGYARPHFPAEITIDPDYTQPEADAAAIEAMRRFARLQRRYGRWGLAYLESLLRAADWAASAAPKGKAGHTQEESP